jgi:hypothetical protein
MASSEQRKPKSIRDEIVDPVNSLTEEQLLKLQPAKAYLTGTSFDSCAGRTTTEESNMARHDSSPNELAGEDAFAFYPSGEDSSNPPKPTLADAVIEHLRQARLRRLRPH